MPCIHLWPYSLLISTRVRTRVLSTRVPVVHGSVFRAQPMATHARKMHAWTCEKQVGAETDVCCLPRGIVPVLEYVLES